MTDKEIIYDVAITGGGLAGLALSIQCAKAGYQTILFEKDDYPRHKVCGEYISLESKPFLEKLGIPVSDIQLPHINRLLTSDVYGNAYYFTLAPGGFGISRYMLDDLLYQRAVNLGVNVLTQEKVVDITWRGTFFKIETDKGTYHSRLSAGSFGKRSNLDVKWKRPFILRKKGKLENFIGVKYHIRLPYPDDQIALHNFKDGYCGISQVEDGICCLCYLTTAANLKASGGSIAQMEKGILMQNPSLKEIFSTAEFIYPEPLVISQVSFSPKASIENHVLMLGDAAGMIPPLCGNGMSMALHSSLMAFEAMKPYLEGQQNMEQMEQDYTSRWKKQFALRLSAGRMIQRFFGRNQTTWFFLKAMKTMPVVSRWVIRATHGEVF